MTALAPCPECGTQAFIARETPDGYIMGWSVGCPRYRLNDGVHKHKMAFHGFDTRHEAEQFWKAYTTGTGKK